MATIFYGFGLANGDTTTEGAGSADGVGTATGVGTYLTIVEGVGSASALGTAEAIGEYLDSRAARRMLSTFDRRRRRTNPHMTRAH